jgi:hypothetical protein
MKITEKAVSKKQQKFMGMVHAMQKGKDIPGASKELKDVAKSMKKSDVKDFAKTKHKGLPEKILKDGKMSSIMEGILAETKTNEALTRVMLDVPEFKKGDKAIHMALLGPVTIKMVSGNEAVVVDDREGRVRTVLAKTLSPYTKVNLDRWKESIGVTTESKRKK